MNQRNKAINTQDKCANISSPPKVEEFGREIIFVSYFNLNNLI